jgi:hypothetical protein
MKICRWGTFVFFFFKLDKIWAVTSVHLTFQVNSPAVGYKTCRVSSRNEKKVGIIERRRYKPISNGVWSPPRKISIFLTNLKTLLKRSKGVIYPLGPVWSKGQAPTYRICQAPTYRICPCLWPRAASTKNQRYDFGFSRSPPGDAWSA